MAKRKQETPEQTVDRWLAGSSSGTSEERAAILDGSSGWEAGQVSHVTAYGANYEKFAVESGYVVIEWDDSGNLSISERLL